MEQTVAVRLSKNFIDIVSQYALVNLRSIPKQIEYWARLGRCVEDNPDLPLDFIRECLISKREADLGFVSDFSFRDER